MAPGSQDDRAVIGALVRSHDRDRYWSALLAPEPVRTHLLSLYAFNIELSRVAEQAREPMLGEMRLQWWREALGVTAKGERAGHPVADALDAARRACGLPEALLHAMIDARRFDLDRRPMADVPALTAYLQHTAGAVFALGCRIAGLCGEEAERAAEQAGLAYGLTGLMRALPYHAARGQIFMPADVLAGHGVAPSAILAGEDTAGLGAALQDMERAARVALTFCRQELAGLPTGMPAVFLPLALVEPYLRRMARPGHRPLRDIVTLNPLVRYGLILWAQARGRV